MNNDKAVFGNNIVKGLEESEFFKTTLFNNKSIETLKNSFKQSLLSALHEFSSGVEAKIIYDTYASLFKELLGIEMKKVSQQPKLIEFNEQYASTLKESVIPNSVQHNVPAYTLFAIFFR